MSEPKIKKFEEASKAAEFVKTLKDFLKKNNYCLDMTEFEGMPLIFAYKNLREDIVVILKL